jgi:hypothetical protein
MAEEKLENVALGERGVMPPAKYAPAQASTLLGVTLVANCEEALAAVRTAILLARNFKSSLYVNVQGATILFDFSEAQPAETVGQWNGAERNRPEWKQTEWHQLEAGLHSLDSSPAAAFVLQFDLTAASILSAGNLWMQVRSVDGNGAGLPAR